MTPSGNRVPSGRRIGGQAPNEHTNHHQIEQAGGTRRWAGQNQLVLFVAGAR